MPAHFKDGRFKLGDDVAAMLSDFCIANYNCPAVEVLREAVRAHILERIGNEPVIRERYERVRRERLGLGTVVAILPKEGGSS